MRLVCICTAVIMVCERADDAHGVAGDGYETTSAPAGSVADTARATRALKTQAAYFIEASATLSRESPIHDALWDRVATIGAPMTM
jgi:hypothetical protein